MSDFTAEVVRYIRRKTANGFDEPLTYLGAEQRFVGPIRNSSLNNLEEQFIVGADTYTEIYTDEDQNTIIDTEYHRNVAGSNNQNYYRLHTIQYESDQINEDYMFSKEQLILPDSPDEVFIDGEILKGENAETFSYKGETMQIFPSTYTTVQIDELYFVRDRAKSPAEDVHVLTKTTGKKLLENGKQILRQSIVNHIKPKKEGEVLV